MRHVGSEFTTRKSPVPPALEVLDLNQWAQFTADNLKLNRLKTLAQSPVFVQPLQRNRTNTFKGHCVFNISMSRRAETMKDGMKSSKYLNMQNTFAKIS